jgi:LysR family transcriptional regulator, transcriptional activator of nhaA
MSSVLNYHHLHCFWAIACDGGISRAAKRLHVTHSTLSVQLRALEEALGSPLFERRGRGLVITPFGDEIRSYADDIFRLGGELIDASRRGGSGRVAVRVGALTTLPKTITTRLLEPMFDAGEFSIDVQHGPFDRLLEELAAGRLHLVLADQPPAAGSAHRLHAHSLGETELLIFGAPACLDKLRGPFPRSLDGAPMLLPRSGSQLRRSIDAWLDKRDLRVNVKAEIDDAGALRAFGLRGLGLFPVRSALASEVADVGGARRLGRLEGLVERYVAITRERTVRHPAITTMIERARARLA